jgi:hypothetical protein
VCRVTLAPAPPNPCTPQTTLLSAKFDPSNLGALKRSSTPWSKLPPASRLVFSSEGKGEVTVAASLNFVPSEVLAFPTYRGLWVSRIVQLETGGAVLAVPLASTVTVSVQVCCARRPPLGVRPAAHALGAMLPGGRCFGR